MKNVFIFDYDGVIVDSLDIFSTHFLKACEKEQVPEISSKQDFLSIYNNNMYETMYSMGMTKEKILRIVNYMKKAILLEQENIKLFPNIKETIQQLVINNQLYIVTSSDTKLVTEFLNKYHLDTFFEEVIGSDQEPSKTKKILSITQNHKEKDCFYIGDTVGDILEGKKAQVKTVAVTWGWHNEKQLAQNNPDYLVHNAKELLAIPKLKNKNIA
ncbi:MAG: HAD family hydrolase [Thermoplasmatota archaeon]